MVTELLSDQLWSLPKALRAFVVLVASLSLAAPANSSTLTKAAPSTFNNSLEAESDLLSPPPSARPALCDVSVRIAVPQKDKAVDIFTAYPYPIRLPTNYKPNRPLPTKEKDLKRQIFHTGYAQRHSFNALPPFGWRWEYAYSAALRRTGEREPTNLFSAMSWTNDLLKHIRPEVERSNQAELRREARYKKALEDYERNGKDIETEALRNGLYSIELHPRSGLAQVKLPAGTWWITGTRKVPGLLYYWQQPVTVSAGEPNSFQLTQANAMIIQGGW